MPPGEHLGDLPGGGPHQFTVGADEFVREPVRGHRYRERGDGIAVPVLDRGADRRDVRAPPAGVHGVALRRGGAHLGEGADDPVHRRLGNVQCARQHADADRLGPRDSLEDSRERSTDCMPVFRSGASFPASAPLLRRWPSVTRRGSGPYTRPCRGTYSRRLRSAAVGRTRPRQRRVRRGVADRLTGPRCPLGQNRVMIGPDVQVPERRTRSTTGRAGRVEVAVSLERLRAPHPGLFLLHRKEGDRQRRQHGHQRRHPGDRAQPQRRHLPCGAGVRAGSRGAGGEVEIDCPLGVFRGCGSAGPWMGLHGVEVQWMRPCRVELPGTAATSTNAGGGGDVPATEGRSCAFAGRLFTFCVPIGSRTAQPGSVALISRGAGWSTTPKGPPIHRPPLLRIPTSVPAQTRSLHHVVRSQGRDR